MQPVPAIEGRRSTVERHRQRTLKQETTKETNMGNYSYNFSDWENGYRQENAPPDAVLDRLPRPFSMSGYNPSWGKYSEGARKAAGTRNYKKHAQNMELFLREVLPVILPLIDSESKHEIGVCFMLPDLMTAGGRSLWHKDGKSSWIKNGDAAESKAVEIGAEKLTIEKAIAFLSERHK